MRFVFCFLTVVAYLSAWQTGLPCSQLLSSWSMASANTFALAVTATQQRHQHGLLLFVAVDSSVELSY